MICEKCGCHDRVIRTVRQDDSTLRVRRCIACGYAVVTEERQIEAENVRIPLPAKPESKPQSKPQPKPKTKSRPRKAKGALEQAVSNAVG